MILKNICLIGNSHAGCFVRGWNATAKLYPDVSVRFYADAGQYFDKLFVSPNKKFLEVGDPEIKERWQRRTGDGGAISLENIDVFLIVGAVKWWQGIDRRAYSQQVVDAATCGFFERTKGYGLAQEIRSASEAPIYLTHVPFPALRREYFANSAMGYQSEVHRINTSLLKAMNAELLEQPKLSYSDVLQSKLKFAVGYRRARGGKLDKKEDLDVIDDLWHMNKAYGALFWREILGKLGVVPNDANYALPAPDGHLDFDVKEKQG